jgi:hypothetical protein
MPARVVVVHRDQKYVSTVHAFLSNFKQCRLRGRELYRLREALRALDAAKTAELLIVRVSMALRMPSGFSLALRATQRREGIQVLYLADPEVLSFVNTDGQVLSAAPQEPELLAAVKSAVAR